MKENVTVDKEQKIIQINMYYDIPEVKPEITYICCLFSTILNCNIRLVPLDQAVNHSGSIPSISYTKENAVVPETCKLHINPDISFWDQYLKRQQLKLNIYKHGNLVFVNSSKLLTEPLSNNGHIHVPADILSTCFFMTSRMEEVLNNENDSHDRFPLAQSIVNEYIDLPIVNILIIHLAELIQSAYGITVSLRDQRMTAIISHDIDIPFFYQKFRAHISEIANAIRNRQVTFTRAFSDYILYWFGIHSDSFDTFKYMINKEIPLGIKSTFFLLLSNENLWGMKWDNYQHSINSIIDCGCEVALHPGYNSYSDKSRIVEELDNLKCLTGIKSCGVRNHFLRFKYPETFSIHDELQFLYDSTLGYSEHEGFRCGISNPYKPYDLINRTIYNVIEIPLTLMDVTLERSRKLSPDEAFECIKMQVDMVDSVKGVIVFNWHNTFLTEKRKEWRNVYEKTLSYLHGKADFKTCSETAIEWSQRWHPMNRSNQAAYTASRSITN